MVPMRRRRTRTKEDVSCPTKLLWTARSCASRCAENYREVAVDPYGDYHFHTGRPLASRLSYDAAAGTVDIPVYALYFVCEDIQGTCLYLRQDVVVKAEVLP